MCNDDERRCCCWCWWWRRRRRQRRRGYINIDSGSWYRRFKRLMLPHKFILRRNRCLILNNQWPLIRLLANWMSSTPRTNFLVLTHTFTYQVYFVYWCMTMCGKAHWLHIRDMKITYRNDVCLLSKCMSRKCKPREKFPGQNIIIRI